MIKVEKQIAIINKMKILSVRIDLRDLYFSLKLGIYRPFLAIPQSIQVYWQIENRLKFKWTKQTQNRIDIRFNIIEIPNNKWHFGNLNSKILPSYYPQVKQNYNLYCKHCQQSNRLAGSYFVSNTNTHTHIQYNHTPHQPDTRLIFPR